MSAQGCAAGATTGSYAKWLRARSGLRHLSARPYKLVSLRPILALFRATFLLALLSLTALITSRAETQTFTLSTDWNLITFQVIPANPSPEAVFANLPGFVAAWSYDTEAGLWRRYVKPTGTQEPNDTVANDILPLGPMKPGHAYWVRQSQRVDAWTVQGTLPKGSTLPGLDLKKGWNLIGIPVGVASSTNKEPVSMLAILTAAGFDYDALLTWDQSLSPNYRKMFRPSDTNSPVAGLPPDSPFPIFDLSKDLNRGYWVHVLDPATLRPRLLATVRPDIDAEPLNNFPAKEDINVSGFKALSTPKSVLNQDTVRFFPGEDVQTISISNLGDGSGSGGGILLWEAIWQPATDLGTPEPWVRLFSAPDQREQRDQTGQLLASYTNLVGVTTLENDIVYLRLDRKNLGRGQHEGTLRLRTSVGDKSYKVFAEVPGLEGDFKGYAVIQSVNGKRNPVPDIDLSITFYEDIRVDGLLRGYIDSSQALLWPVDVPLVGYRVADEGNQFIMGGSFVLPPGDQNGEPYDSWNENDHPREDVDWLNDGKLDALNPFPFPIQRTVSLEGSLIQGNPTDGYVIEGKYTDIVHGMSREPITLLGTFHLDRQSARPFTSRRSLTADTGVEPVVLKKVSTPLLIPAGEARSSNLIITNEMELQSLQVGLAFSAPLPHASLRISLQTPSNQQLLLYNGADAATRINPKLLESVTFPIDRPTQDDLAAFIKQVSRTRGDSAQGNFWKLNVQNTGSSSVSLSSWSLRIEGQPVADVYGVVKDSNGPVSGVTVGLNGVPISLYSAPTGPDGLFTLQRVPLLPLNFSASRPGYSPLDPTNPGLSNMFTKPFVGMQGLAFTPMEAQLIGRFNSMAGAPPAAAHVAGFSSGSTNSPFELAVKAETIAGGAPRIIASPIVVDPGTLVEFYSVGGGNVTWDFGDGAASRLTAEAHAFSAPGVYVVKLAATGNPSTIYDSVKIIVMPVPGNSPRRPIDLVGVSQELPAETANANYTAYAYQVFFNGAGVIPAHKEGTLPSGADRYVTDVSPQSSFARGETNDFGAAFVSAMPLQQMYSASMDIDLAPKVTPTNTSQLFSADGFTPLSSPGFDPSINTSNLGFKDEDFNYALIESLWSNTRAIDGNPEYAPLEGQGFLIWGYTESPVVNFATQDHKAADGVTYQVTADDDTFHPHSGTTTVSAGGQTQTITHYMMACSIGGTIAIAPTSPTSVRAAKLRRSDADNPLEPELLPGPAAVARNLYYQLRMGSLVE